MTNTEQHAAQGMLFYTQEKQSQMQALLSEMKAAMHHTTGLTLGSKKEKKKS